jgi:hypothetical protein
MCSSSGAVLALDTPTELLGQVFGNALKDFWQVGKRNLRNGAAA